MERPKRTRIKICCIGSVEEARMAVEYGASALGLVSEMPSGPGIISEDMIARIAATVPPGVATFLLTSKEDAASIIAQQRRCGVNTIQLCDRLRSGSYQELREAMPGIRLVQVIHVTGQESVHEAAAVAPYVDAILLDSGNPSLPVKELGGTARTHDWTISRRIRDLVSVPIFLAGGLHHANILSAIRWVRPFGVDVCSGVRVNGALNERALARFFGQIALNEWYESGNKPSAIRAVLP